MINPILIILVKAPLVGRAKTRLGADIGMGRAACIFETLTNLTVKTGLRAQSRRTCLEVALAIDPITPLWGNFPCWPAHVARIAQSQGSLGDRMTALLRQFPHRPVIFTGADTPDISADYILQAVDALTHHDCVFGPAEDGGFWLMGLAQRNHAPDVFHQVRWSSAHTLCDTEASLPEKFSIQKLQKLRDIDYSMDLMSRKRSGFLLSICNSENNTDMV